MYERGQRDPGLEDLMRLVHVLQVTPNELLVGDLLEADHTQGIAENKLHYGNALSLTPEELTAIDKIRQMDETLRRSTFAIIDVLWRNKNSESFPHNEQGPKP